jgi:hypothetical protein
VVVVQAEAHRGVVAREIQVSGIVTKFPIFQVYL